MITRDSDRTKIPGPLGILPGPVTGTGGRVPGPLGFGRIFMAPVAGLKAVKTTTMPLPTKDNDNKDVHEVTWPLFKKGPVHTEVQQAPGIANCPVAAILAALAFTSAGRTIIQGMVSETAATVLTDLSSLPAGTLTNPPKGNTVSSSRFFTVKLPRGAVEVSDVLYTDDHDSGWSPFYMRDPGGQVIWASIIEKALAVQLGSYENFDALNLTANDFWERITGAQPGGIEIKDDTPLSAITGAASAASSVPTIGASKADGKDVKVVTPFHGFALLGVRGSQIQLYDPAKAKSISISAADFRHDFQAILFRR